LWIEGRQYEGETQGRRRNTKEGSKTNERERREQERKRDNKKSTSFIPSPSRSVIMGATTTTKIKWESGQGRKDRRTKSRRLKYNERRKEAHSPKRESNGGWCTYIYMQYIWKGTTVAALP
jgi:hypothetical protein